MNLQDFDKTDEWVYYWRLIFIFISWSLIISLTCIELANRINRVTMYIHLTYNYFIENFLREKNSIEKALLGNVFMKNLKEYHISVVET